MKRRMIPALLLLLVFGAVSFAQETALPELGLRFPYDKEMEGSGLCYSASGLCSITHEDVGYLALYCVDMDRVNAAYEQALAGELSAETYSRISRQNQATIGFVYVMSDALAENFYGTGDVRASIEQAHPGADIRLLHGGEGWSYYWVDMSETVDKDALGEGMEERLDQCLPMAEKIIEGLAFTQVVEIGSELKEHMSFDTVSLTGERVTDEVFSGYDVTIVNVWATWCGFCLREMPELAQWQKELPENVQLFYLCSDANSPEDEAQIAAVREIVQKAGVPESSVLCWLPGAFDSLDRIVTDYPTTFFFDAEGKLIESATVVGAVMARYRAALEKILQ